VGKREAYEILLHLCVCPLQVLKQLLHFEKKKWHEYYATGDDSSANMTDMQACRMGVLATLNLGSYNVAVLPKNII
jgi:hypothetical protein